MGLLCKLLASTAEIQRLYQDFNSAARSILAKDAKKEYFRISLLGKHCEIILCQSSLSPFR